MRTQNQQKLLDAAQNNKPLSDVTGTTAADYAVQDDVGRTPLFLASKKCNIDNVKFALKMNKNVIDVAKKDGTTPLMITAFLNADPNGEVVKALLLAGASTGLNRALKYAKRGGAEKKIELIENAIHGILPSMNSSGSSAASKNASAASSASSAASKNASAASNGLSAASKNASAASSASSAASKNASAASSASSAASKNASAASNGLSAASKNASAASSASSAAFNSLSAAFSASSADSKNASAARVNTPGSCDTAADDAGKDYQGRTPIQMQLLAAAQNNTPLSAVSCATSAHYKVIDDEGRTPLLWASQNCNLENVKTALKMNKDVVNTATYDGTTPLMITSLQTADPNGEVVKALLLAGASAGSKREDGLDALGFANMSNVQAKIDLIQNAINGVLPSAASIGGYRRRGSRKAKASRKAKKGSRRR
jgi:ankyrin repeat protein